MGQTIKEKMKAALARIKAERIANGGSPVRHFHRLPAVEEMTGYKRTQIYEKIAQGEFPAPVPLSDSGRAVAWDDDELAAWQEIRIAARDGRPR